MIRFAVAIALLFSLALIPDRKATAEASCEAPPSVACPEGELKFKRLTKDEWQRARERIFDEDKPPPDKDTPPDTSGTPPDGDGNGDPQQPEAGPPPDTGGGAQAANTWTVDALASRLTAAKSSRQTAMKLHAGISAPDDTAGTGERSAEYDTFGNVEVTIGEATAVNLTEDKDATVAANHGWEGKKYTASPTGGGMYEAVVYSNVGDPTEGEKGNGQSSLATVKAGARVTEMADADYASYGWWLHTAEDGTLTASAFVDDRGTVDAASGLTALRGTATYLGGAAGKYALSSSTGGTNDAGHFTARVTLKADFNNDTITGTIDQFMGAGGQSRNWSVALMKSAIGDTGLIRQSDDENRALAADASGGMTTWTIDGTAADAAGQWSGALKNNGDDDVPQVATGTFYSEYGTAGRMVGAFGANKQ